MTSSQPPKCRDCGSTTVAWKQSKAGKWYLAEVRPSRTLSHEEPVVRGPHFQFCTASGQAARNARNAAIEAARAEEQDTIARLVADRAPIADLIKAGANMAQILASGATTADIQAYYEENK